mgnify:CR=1 FL=1
MFVFALVTLLGTQVISTEYFNDINRCLYFAERLNKQPPIPTKIDKERATVRITAYCKPTKLRK